jgi:hypothetical protein
LAQEGSQKVQVQSSQLNLRMIGSAAITNPIGSKLRSQCQGSSRRLDNSRSSCRCIILLTIGAGS